MTGEQSESGDEDSPEDARMHAAALVSARMVVCNFFKSTPAVCQALTQHSYAGCPGICWLQDKALVIHVVHHTSRVDWGSAVALGSTLSLDFNVDNGQVPLESCSLCSSQGTHGCKS